MTVRVSRDIAVWIDEAVEQVLANPQGWGGVDALEPIVLLLLILRGELMSPPVARTEVLRRYWKFVADTVAPGSADLRTRLGANLSTDSMVAVLRAHHELVRARPEASRRPPASGPRPALPRFMSVERGVHGV